MTSLNEKIIKTHSEFAPYEIALALKEVGFDEECLSGWAKPNLKFELFPGYFKNSETINYKKEWIAAPLYQQVFRWFQKEHFLYAYIQPMPRFKFMGVIKSVENSAWIGDVNFFTDKYEKYETVKIKCLKKLIEIVKEKK